MAVDKTDRLGLLKWPVIVLVGGTQLLCLLYPPAWLGAVVGPVALGMTSAAQNVLRLLEGDNLMAKPLVDSIELRAVAPLSIFFMLFLFTARFTVKKFISDYTKTPDDARKFAECFVRLTYYFLTWTLAFFLAQSEGYFPDVGEVWTQFGHGQPRPLLVEALYILQLSYYTGGVLIHLLIDQPLKDFWVMLIHHIVTIMLINMSYDVGLHRVGVVILLIHDISDVLLDGAKCFHYVGLDALSNVTFVNLIISWLLFRMWYYPLFILESGAVDVPVLERSWNMVIPMYNVFFCLLVVLQLLHVYWFTLILKVAQRAMTEGIEDVRDEDALKHSKKHE